MYPVCLGMLREARYYLLYAVSRTIRASDDIVIVRSIPPFSDNAHALYVYYEQKLSDLDIKMLWVASRSREVKYYTQHLKPFINLRKPEHIRLFFRAKVIADTGGTFSLTRRVSPIKSRGQRWIFMWHGVPIKTHRVWDWRSRSLLVYNVNTQYDFGISTSKFSSVLLSAYSGLDFNKFVITGYPRNDLMFWGKTRSRGREFLSSIVEDPESYDKILLLAPTWRFWIRDSMLINLGHAFYHILDNLRRLDRLLGRENMIMLFKPHQIEENIVLRLLGGGRLRSLANIRLLTIDDLLQNEITIYHILPHVDCLITDYSSIAIDFLLLDRPIIFIRERGAIKNILGRRTGLRSKARYI